MRCTQITRGSCHEEPTGSPVFLIVAFGRLVRVGLSFLGSSPRTDLSSLEARYTYASAIAAILTTEAHAPFLFFFFFFFSFLLLLLPSGLIRSFWLPDDKMAYKIDGKDCMVRLPLYADALLSTSTSKLSTSVC